MIRVCVVEPDIGCEVGTVIRRNQLGVRKYDGVLWPNISMEMGTVLLRLECERGVC